MTPDDLTRTSPPDATRDGSDAALDAGLAAAFGGYTTHLRPPSADPEAGTVIAGKYKLTEKVGEGGMGSVWVANQTEPVKRKVAVKLIKAGMDSKQVLARFEAERQALAVMDHPNIAKVLDGGLHDGRPYFVMELVKGVPITTFCDARKLTPQQRLELFVPVCQAIQHAHQKGVIHRDIKPSNVLVALYDDKPVPKVIDFGIAKATGAALTEHTLDTGIGAVVGTPAYMSPEQASLNNLDIDTRSDVYALGVLLYELLTGSPPFSGKELQKQGLLEMLRVVREEEPPRPSAKLSTADALPSLSANRGTEPKKLTGLLRNELDWIVMKALEKDRARRYDTANGFAADVTRYLSGEAVQAHPPSTAYRVKKFVRRNRVQVTAAGVVFVVLLAGMAGTTFGLLQADEKRRDAEQAREDEAEQRRVADAEKGKAVAAAEEERKAKREADAKRAEAETNLGFATSSNAILGSVFAGLPAKYETAADLRDALKANLTKAIKELDGSAIGDPLVVARMQYTLGQALQGLGDYDQAVALYSKCRDTRLARLGAVHPDTLSAVHQLAITLQMNGRHDQALALLEGAVKATQDELGGDHPTTLAAMSELAVGYRLARRPDKALPLLEKVLPLRTAILGAGHTDTLASMCELGIAYQDASKFDLALPLLEKALAGQKAAGRADHSDTLYLMQVLAFAYQNSGQPAKTVPLLEEVYRLYKANPQASQQNTLNAMLALGEGYTSVGNRDKAVPLLEEAVKLYKEKLGVNHEQTLVCVNALAVAYEQSGQLDKAVLQLEDSYDRLRTTAGTDHPTTLAVMNNLAHLYQDAGKSDKAVPLCVEVLRLKRAKLGADHLSTLTSMNNLASTYVAVGQADKAIPLFKEAIERTTAQWGADYPQALVMKFGLATALAKTGQTDKAMPLYEEVYKLSKIKLGWEDPTTLDALNSLVAAYRVGGHGEKVTTLLAELVAATRKQLPKDSVQIAKLLAQVSNDLLSCGQFSSAELYLRECLEIREKHLPDAWSTFNTQSMLGGALLGQKKYADAEPLLVKGYEGMKERENDIPKGAATRIPEALDRLIELYTATGNPDEVKKYKDLRAKYPTPTREVLPPPRADK